MWGRQWLLPVVFVLAALVAGAGWIYMHPPLVSSGMAELHDGEGTTVIYGIDLKNRGQRPLTLIAVKVNGKELAYPQAMAVANFADGLLASSAATMMEEHGQKLDIGPIEGWRLLPHQPRRGTYALRLDWEGMPSPPGEIVVYYRYLGLPLQYTVPWTHP